MHIKCYFNFLTIRRYFSEKCRECCLKDDDDDALGLKRYPKAVLEVCTCKFGAYPQIQGITFRYTYNCKESVKSRKWFCFV